MVILISIKPQYVEKILSGEKKYEYRRIAPRVKVEKMIVYCTSPVKKVVAEVEILDILEGTPKQIWNKTREEGGISKENYFNYFQYRDTAYAIKLGKVTPLDKELKDYRVNWPPQSFIYLLEEEESYEEE